MCSSIDAFIEEFSYILRSLHDLTKKNVKFVCSKKKNYSFETLKAKLNSQPILILLDLSKPFEVQYDACMHSLGVVLL